MSLRRDEAVWAGAVVDAISMAPSGEGVVSLGSSAFGALSVVTVRGKAGLGGCVRSVLGNVTRSCRSTGLCTGLEGRRPRNLVHTGGRRRRSFRG